VLGRIPLDRSLPRAASPLGVTRRNGRP
jgi:hypothetical protein